MRSRSAWHDRRLDELAYTVFDTETTGLQPTHGDEIISVGAVRVVNGRLLRQETFERLVDPQPLGAGRLDRRPRHHPGDGARAADDRHGAARCSPAIAADTVLVGHNVGFDMQFLRLKEDRPASASPNRSWTRCCSTRRCTRTTRSTPWRPSRSGWASRWWAGTPRSATPW